MKAGHFPRHCLAGIFAVGALLTNQPAHAADGTWIETGAGPFDWSLTNTASWDSGTVADGIDSTAFFTPDITANQTVNLAENRTIGNITFTDSTTSSHNLTISGANILTLDRTAGIPVIDVTQSNRTLTISSVIAGSDGLQKNGAGTLALSGANTYTGGTTLSAGVLVISHANSLSSGSVSVTGNSRINSTGGITYANDISIDSGAVLTMQNVGGNTTSTYSGAITGLGGITNVTGSGGGSQTITLSNTNNTFTGDLTLATGTGANDFINFASIGDGGSIAYGRASWRANATYTGSAALNLGTRTISLATTFGNAGGYDGGGNPTHMFANNGAGIVTINTDMVMTTTASSGIFFFGGTNTGDNTFAGAIADPTGANTLGIGKWDAGKWILSNNTNSFEGNVVLARGTLSVGVIDVAANAQPLGKGSLIVMGYRTADVGTLEYTGSGNAVTDKQITVGTPASSTNNNFRGGGVILNNGAGTLTFSNTTFNSTAGVPATGTGRDRTLTLDGTNTGANTIAGTIQDNNNGTVNAKVFLTKTGAGTWILEGDNTYTGTTAIQGGVLVADHVNAIAGGLAFGGTGAAITLTGGGILGLGADDFTRLPDFNATVSTGKITFLDNGGFAAYGADRIVNFGGSSGIVAIGSTATPGVLGNMNGKTFILGHATATHKVTVTNTLDFGGGSRTIQVNDGAAAVDAEISGVLQPQAAATNIGLTKAGTGTLLLSNSNTLDGTTAINGGTLIITGATQATSAITFSGGGKLGLDIASPVTATSATVDFTGQQVLVTGTPTLSSYTLLTGLSITGTPTLATAIPGYTLVTDGTTLKLNSTGGSPYDTWAASKGLTGLPGSSTDPAKDADPDNDGRNNLGEFAFNGDPLSGSDNGKLFVLTEDSDFDGDVIKELILTVAVRTGTPVFTGTPSPFANQASDDITYSIEGSLDLASFPTTVNVVPTPVTTGLPAAGTGYEYRSFSLNGSNGLTGKGFLRAKVTSP